MNISKINKFPLDLGCAMPRRRWNRSWFQCWSQSPVGDHHRFLLPLGASCCLLLPLVAPTSTLILQKSAFSGSEFLSIRLNLLEEIRSTMTRTVAALLLFSLLDGKRYLWLMFLVTEEHFWFSGKSFSFTCTI